MHSVFRDEFTRNSAHRCIREAVETPIVDKVPISSPNAMRGGLPEYQPQIWALRTQRIKQNAVYRSAFRNRILGFCRICYEGGGSELCPQSEF